MECGTPDDTSGPAFDLNDYGGPEVISNTFNRAMTGNLDPDKVFAFHIYHQNGQLFWEISSHDSFDFYQNITAYKGTIPHI
ncbi:hypothetical protein HMPREF1531_01952 [Propionibacterium sp. oral taxon 192 str. F0372]|nr:hypothetical protein HMPREF1531_01952 [Propionibacterium sp. oral taxon 192 str. F0372]